MIFSRKIEHVRKPETGEKNANIELIEKGARAINLSGDLCSDRRENSNSEMQTESEKVTAAANALLSTGKSYSLKQLIAVLNINWSESKARRFLDSMPEIEKRKQGNKVLYQLKKSSSGVLPLEFD